MSHQKRKTYPELHFDPEIPPELDVLLDPPPAGSGLLAFLARAALCRSGRRGERAARKLILQSPSPALDFLA